MSSNFSLVVFCSKYTARSVFMPLLSSLATVKPFSITIFSILLRCANSSFSFIFRDLTRKMNSRAVAVCACMWSRFTASLSSSSRTAGFSSAAIRFFMNALLLSKLSRLFMHTSSTSVTPLRTDIRAYIFAPRASSDRTDILLGLIEKKTSSVLEPVFSEYSVMPSMPMSCLVACFLRSASCCCFFVCNYSSPFRICQRYSCCSMKK